MRSVQSAISIASRTNVFAGRYAQQNYNYKSSHAFQLILQNYFHGYVQNRDRRDGENQCIHKNIVSSPLLYQFDLTQNCYNINRRQQHIRSYVTATQPKPKAAALMMGFGSIALTAKAGQYIVQAYNQWQESQPPPEEVKEEKKSETTSKFDSADAASESGRNTKKEETKSQTKKKDGKRENVFAKLFNMNVGAKYYEGGFDDKMTRREAALILGVRESSTAKRIKDSHRKLLILNHPDTGGSTYLAGKLNEAKELLLKGNKR
jgi:hypothetical protein